MPLVLTNVSPRCPPDDMEMFQQSDAPWTLGAVTLKFRADASLVYAQIETFSRGIFFSISIGVQRGLPREYSLRQHLPTPTVQTLHAKTEQKYRVSVSNFWDFSFEDTCNGNTGYLNALAHCTQYIQLPSNFPLTFSHSCFTIGEQPRGHWLEPLSRTAVRSSLRLYVSGETGHQFF